MSTHTWTPDEDARIAPHVGRLGRYAKRTIDDLVWYLGLRPAQIRRRRRVLRRHLRRGH